MPTIGRPALLLQKGIFLCHTTTIPVFARVVPHETCLTSWVGNGARVGIFPELRDKYGISIYRSDLVVGVDIPAINRRKPVRGKPPNIGLATKTTIHPITKYDPYDIIGCAPSDPYLYKYVSTSTYTTRSMFILPDRQIWRIRFGDTSRKVWQMG